MRCSERRQRVAVAIGAPLAAVAELSLVRPKRVLVSHRLAFPIQCNAIFGFFPLVFVQVF